MNAEWNFEIRNESCFENKSITNYNNISPLLKFENEV